MRVAVAAVSLVASLAVAGCFNVGPDRVVPKDYLTAEEYTKWVIEVDYSNGHLPSQALRDFLHGRLAPLMNKESVTFVVDEQLPASDTAWTDADVRSFAATHRGRATGGDTVVTHLLFLAGHSEHDTDDGKVLGVAYGHDLIVIFSDSVRRSCSTAILPQLCSPDPYFRAVTLHEFGHAIGLVDNGVPMVNDHEASDCAGQPDQHHSRNSASVMYCQVETSAIVPLFGNEPPTNFDADDRADLRAAGGK